MDSETITIEINAADAAKLRASGHDPSALARASITRALEDVNAANWANAHAAGIESHNALLDAEGLWSDELRVW